MRATTVAVLPVRLTAALGVLLAGCVQVPQSPDSDYRQAFEKALVVGQCEGEAVEGMWAAYGRWYAVASAIPGHRKTDEAEALLRQGDLFQVIGCPGVARASYTALLRRFPEIDFTPLRDSARMALGSLPPPPSVPAPAVPAYPAASRI
ncbi:hypothetical protein [Azospirillum doebereinerae]|uniref:Lipoprotein n=1 Tax=Azospirillum doebereinerae TaxID=92933 RepID=A0A3S1CEV4_9PROT|nr:hypothetical protein [Azospirillum doebereinerae]MCG5243503.1 hypothetical protein [Azospirillum doebereinerae]RUQ66602.1 hypothetical protein EJ913_22515 [Azospirillum doebereinerae]